MFLLLSSGIWHLNKLSSQLTIFTLGIKVSGSNIIIIISQISS